MRVLAIIPARGGSKGIPKKNLVTFLGKPLINWSIEAGLNSKFVNDVVVSSDSNEILESVKKFEQVLSKIQKDPNSSFNLGISKDIFYEKQPFFQKNSYF
jgi:CMP-N-acetylneuraminic acid synthetase